MAPEALSGKGLLLGSAPLRDKKAVDCSAVIRTQDVIRTYSGISRDRPRSGKQTTTG